MRQQDKYFSKLVHTLIKVGISLPSSSFPHITPFRLSATSDSGSLCKAAQRTERRLGFAWIPLKQRLTLGILSGPSSIVLALDETMLTGGGAQTRGPTQSCD